MKNFKKKQFEDRILREVNRILRQGNFRDVRLNGVSATRVELNADFSFARIYWDSFDRSRKEAIMDAMGGIAPAVRSLLASGLQMRRTPEIVFHYDEQYDAERNIEQLISRPLNAGP